jgi:spoIIIJ-associated protein
MNDGDLDLTGRTEREPGRDASNESDEGLDQEGNTVEVGSSLPSDDDEEDDEAVSGNRADLPDSVAGVVGVEVLSRLLELMGLEGDVSSRQTEDSLVLDIEGDDLGVLIGRRGITLSSLQHIARLMVAARQSEWPLLTVDVCGYKQRRRLALEDLAKRLADQAKYRRRPIALEPMPPDERRVVHLALANNPDVYTESEGEESERKVVIHPKRL